MTTKNLKTLLIVVDAVLIILMLVTWSFLQESIQNDNNNLNQLISRKEDLMSQQQILESLVNDMNNTVQQEMRINENLKAELAKATHDAALSENVTLAQNTPKTPPKPVITPVVPRIVTRAS